MNQIGVQLFIACLLSAFLFTGSFLFLSKSPSHRTLVANSGSHSQSCNQIHVVYYVYLPDNTNWQALLKNQLSLMNETGLLQCAHVHMVISTSANSNSDPKAFARLTQAILLVKLLVKNALVHPSIGNEYEYPGLLKAWELAFDIPIAEANTTYILYTHSKGMVFSGNAGQATSSVLIRVVVQPWHKILWTFSQHPLVNKIGFSAGPGGFIFFNYFWVRASYMRTVVRPVSTKDRYAHEVWIHRRSTVSFPYAYRVAKQVPEVLAGDYGKECNDTWSIAFPGQESRCFSPQETLHQIAALG